MTRFIWQTGLFAQEEIMLKRVVLGVVSVLAFSAVSVHADPKDDINTALQKLVDSPNYSWTTTTQGGFGRGPQDGKTQKDGYTEINMQMRDNTFEIILKGDKAAIKTDAGWKSATELMAENGDDAGGPPPPERFAAMFAQNFKTPVSQAQSNIDNLQNIQKTDDGYTADLTPDAAKTLLSFRPSPAGADDVTLCRRRERAATPSADRRHRSEGFAESDDQRRQPDAGGIPSDRLDQLQRRRSARCGSDDDD